MQKSFAQQEHNTGVFSFEFTKEEFTEAVNWAFKRNAKRFNVPGFRKGKAPLAIVLSYYGESALYDEAVDHIIAPAYEEAVKEFAVSPVSQPELDIQEIGMDKGLTCTLTFDTEPVPVLGEYRGVEAVKPRVEISDEDVEKEFERVRERNSRLVPIEDRAAENDDTANIDFEGFLDGEAFEGGSGKEYDLVLGSGSFIPGFEEQIVGHMPGEEFDVLVTFPEDYNQEDLAGQDAVFKVKLNSLKHKELPEADDDFAMDVSEFDTLAEYKNSIREELTKDAEDRATKTFENNVIRKVADNAEIEIPHSMVHSEMEQILNYQRQQMRQQGIELEQYLQFVGQSVEQYTHSLHEPAEDQLKVQLVLKAVAQAEGLTLTDEDKDNEIALLASQTGLSEDEVRRQVGDNEMFFENALNTKAIRFLTEHAIAVDPPENEEPLDNEELSDDEVLSDDEELFEESAAAEADEPLTDQSETEE